MFMLVLLGLLSVLSPGLGDTTSTLGKGILETLIDEVSALRNDVDRLEQELLDRDRYPIWHLAMNLNPSDGHIMDYTTGWYDGKDIGNLGTAFTKDYLNASVWRQRSNYIALARHQDGVMDAVKVWRFVTQGESLLKKFQSSHNSIVTHGGPVQVYISKNALNMQDDAVFSVGGDLMFNLRYSNDGNRIVLPDGVIPADIFDENARGLGGSFCLNDEYTQCSSSFKQEVAVLQACQVTNTCGSNKKMQGTDFGTYSHHTGVPAYGNYAIFVSAGAARFPIIGSTLATEMDPSWIN